MLSWQRGMRYETLCPVTLPGNVMLYVTEQGGHPFKGPLKRRVKATKSDEPFVQALADNAELAKRNTRLIEESEALLMRCQANSNGDAQTPSSPAIKKSKKGLFAFRKCVSLTS